MRVVIGIISVIGSDKGNVYWIHKKGQYDDTGSANGDLGAARINKTTARALLDWSFKSHDRVPTGQRKVLGSVTVHLT